MTPLRQEWQETRAAIDKLLDSEQESNAVLATTQRTGFEPLTALATALRTTAREQLDAFRQRLASVKVLDPACGSGNFLYIALRSLLDLEREVIDFAAVQGWHGLTPSVQPDQMLGTGDQPLRGGTGTDGAVDRLYPVAPCQRLPLHTATATDPAGHDTADRRDTGPNRPGTIRRNRNGRRRSSSWGTRHFWDTSLSGSRWAMITWKRCTGSTATGYPIQAIYAATG